MMMFTGTIVRVESCWPNFGEEDLMAFTILPYGLRRTETVKAYFIPSNTAPEYEDLPDMLHNTYQVIGAFEIPALKPGANIKNFWLLSNPETASLKTGICWKLQARVAGVHTTASRSLSISVDVEIALSKFVLIYANLQNESQKPKDDKVYCFKGILRPSGGSGLEQSACEYTWSEEIPETMSEKTT
ncbi:hypothetical protein G6011_01364 [Alternaria panax]|uniref:Uncharacterized protein n=1 Tax=Alternaria panax TaxID=48097 RepID=A0AAD4IKS9_9PLEO|nr:hypothetical protein G6011_01364 [Alternaria panax]